MESNLLFFLSIAFVILIIFFAHDKQSIKKTSPRLMITGYELIYTDQKGDVDIKKVVVSEILESEKYNLRGKPDYVFYKKSKKEMIPVELKSGKIDSSDKPHYNDLMQLAAYFLMVEDVFSVTVKEGRIIYKDYMFIIKNTRALRNELLKIIGDMRTMIDTGEGVSKASFATCRYCICKGTVCEFCKDAKILNE